jgi:glucose-6-phosphate isomerase
MDRLDTSTAWQALTKHCQQIANLKIKDQFVSHPERVSEFSLWACGLFLDYSKNRITAETMKLLYGLAQTAEVTVYREKMFSGDLINVTEKRAVLHTALRNPGNEPAAEMVLVKRELKRIAKCVSAIRDGKWLGFSGQAITDVVNIGIGGSDLGPAMVVSALRPYVTRVKVHFVSNVDATHISETLKYLNPKTTVFIISSKTFTTQETLTNAHTAKEWLLHQTVDEAKIIKQHFIAVTAKSERAIEFGIDQENIFPIWDWVGGRFSLWSAIGLSIAIAIGMERFYQLLAGAHAMDRHFCEAPLEKNMPVILALLGIWNINFLGATTHAVIPYDQYLSLLPAYLQQLEMESNGKRVLVNGKTIDYKTAPVVWGAVGTNGQHAFHQLLMQGTQMVPVDFIVALESHNPIRNHHLLLYANCLAQSQALMCGRSEDEVVIQLCEQGMTQEEARMQASHRVIPGNIPSNTIVAQNINPESLGALIALYEHKVFVQGIIWRINSFDQWGVELGKHLASKLTPVLQGSADIADLDGSTARLVSVFALLSNRLQDKC